MWPDFFHTVMNFTGHLQKILYPVLIHHELEGCKHLKKAKEMGHARAAEEFAENCK